MQNKLDCHVNMLI